MWHDYVYCTAPIGVGEMRPAGLRVKMKMPSRLIDRRDAPSNLLTWSFVLSGVSRYLEGRRRALAGPHRHHTTHTTRATVLLLRFHRSQATDKRVPAAFEVDRAAIIGPAETTRDIEGPGAFTCCPWFHVVHDVPRLSAVAGGVL